MLLSLQTASWIWSPNGFTSSSQSAMALTRIQIPLSLSLHLLLLRVGSREQPGSRKVSVCLWLLFSIMSSAPYLLFVYFFAPTHFFALSLPFNIPFVTPPQYSKTTLYFHRVHFLHKLRPLYHLCLLRYDLWGRTASYFLFAVSQTGFYFFTRV